jgi:hypothetical protein
MRTIITGAPDITDYRWLLDAIERSGFSITSVLTSTKLGTDVLAKRFATENKLPLTIFEPEWKVMSCKMVPLHNKRMVEMADAVIALFCGRTPAAQSVLKLAYERNLKTHTHYASVWSFDRELEVREISGRYAKAN